MKSVISKINSWVIAACFVLGGFVWAAPGDLVKVGGTVAGFSGLTSDNLVDGAIVLPSFSADDLFGFQIDQFMGEPENMTVGGLFSAEVPANFYFPKQKERWGLFPVSFGKESFSLMVVPGEKREVTAAWFQLPFDKLVEMNNNHLPSTSLLPLLKIKKLGFLEEKDWSVVNSIPMKLDRDLGTKVKYSWNRSAVSGNDVDAAFLFEATSTDRWVFVNLKGNPAKSGEIEGMKGLEDNFKVIFMRTHSPEQDVTSAEGHIRGATSLETVKVEGVPPALDAKLVGSKITWTPIQSPGWVSLNIAPKKQTAAQPLFSLNNMLGGIFGAFALRNETVQMWIDPKTGNSGGLDSASLKNTDIVVVFVGTTVDLPAPEEGADNSAFLDAASEIRMNKVQ